MYYIKMGPIVVLSIFNGFMKKNNFYSVADLKISINNCSLPEQWKYFRVCNGENRFNSEIQVDCMEGYDFGFAIEKITIQNAKLCFRRGKDILLVDEEWKYAQILPLKDMHSLSVFLLQMFYSNAVQKGMIQVHSAMISYKGKALLFLGPSGVGKTTQAELWNRFMGATIVNGDMNFIQEIDDKYFGWGTPWHGSSVYCKNMCIPVHALIIVKQDKKALVRHLEGEEKVQKVLANIIFPTWYDNGMDMCLNILDHILTFIPVFELSCQPNQEAVNILEKTIF